MVAVIALAVVFVPPAEAVRGAAAQEAIVTKTPNPTSLPEPGGNFTFTVRVANQGFPFFQIRSMIDSLHGDLATRGSCNTAPNTILAPNASYTCSYVAAFNGNAGATQASRTTVSALVGSGGGGVPGTVVASTAFTADALVSITDGPPTVRVTKSPSPAARPAPGGNFTYTIDVVNTSNRPVTITGLTDNVYGNLANRVSCDTAVGTVIPPQASFTCSFTAPFTAAANTSLTDQVTVDVVDVLGLKGSATASATVNITSPVTIQTTTSTSTSTSSTSTTSTSVPIEVTVPPPIPTTSAPPSLELVSGPSSEPGGEVDARGAGCRPNGPVALLLGTATSESSIGTAQAGPDGTFETTIDLPDLPIGRVQLSAECGPRLTAPLDIVVSSQVDTGTPTLAVFIFFVLLCLALFRRRRLILPQRRPDDDRDLL